MSFSCSFFVLPAPFYPVRRLVFCPLWLFHALMAQCNCSMPAPSSPYDPQVSRAEATAPQHTALAPTAQHSTALQLSR